MSRPSSVDRLPDEVKAEIGRLRGNGHTIDEILAALRELDGVEVSRSALGRHIKGMEAIGRKLRQSRDVAEAMVRQLGDAPASKTAQLNIQLVHSALLDFMMPGEADAPAAEVDADALMKLAKALDHLTRSSKTDAEFVKQVELRAEARAQKAAADTAVVVARQQGLSADTIAAIRAGILGK